MTDYSPLDQTDKSTHKCEIVVVHPEPHPNADRLEVVMVYGYSVCIGKGNFKDGDLGIYIPPDSIVPQTPVFAFIWEGKGYIPTIDQYKVVVDNVTKDKELLPNTIPERFRRVKAKVLRGVVSEGLLLPVTDFPSHFIDNGKVVAMEGEDVAEELGITHYNPPEATNLAGDCDVAPNKFKKRARYPKTLRGWIKFLWHKLFPKDTIIGHEENTGLVIPNYDIDSWQRYRHFFKEGEAVWVTEKIHGANCKFTYAFGDSNTSHDGNGKRMYVGSHYQWKKDVPGSVFWMALRQNPWIEEFCKAHPGLVLYGELVPTQKMNYGQSKGSYRIFMFDVLDPSLRDPDQPQGKWLNNQEISDLGILANWVPTLGIVTYTETLMRELSNGKSTVPGANHIREGIVIKPLTERIQPRFGRVILKLVSVDYLASKHSE
jgi:hypothetical protein